MAGRVLSVARAASLVGLAVVSLATIALAPPAAATDYRSRGDRVTVEGTVTDRAGAPVPDLSVILLAAHRGFDFNSMRRSEEGWLKVRGRTDAQGRFSIDWTWHPYYDAFRIRAEAPGAPASASGSGLPPGVLTEIDLTRRMLEGSPVVVALEVGWTGISTAAAAAHSDDQRRIYGEMGNPDRVDRLEMPGGDEVAWWYFERGRSYHFRDGQLDQVMEFEPVKGF